MIWITVSHLYRLCEVINLVRLSNIVLKMESKFFTLHFFLYFFSDTVIHSMYKKNLFHLTLVYKSAIQIYIQCIKNYKFRLTFLVMMLTMGWERNNVESKIKSRIELSFNEGGAWLSQFTFNCIYDII